MAPHRDPRQKQALSGSVPQGIFRREVGAAEPRGKRNGTQEAQEAQEEISFLVPLVLLVFRSFFPVRGTLSIYATENNPSNSSRRHHLIIFVRNRGIRRAHPAPRGCD